MCASTSNCKTAVLQNSSLIIPSLKCGLTNYEKKENTEVRHIILLQESIQYEENKNKPKSSNHHNEISWSA
ncbi:hypothetical protein Y032_0083g1629 [Ancylostoma ceylanicum]|uniref:Uncharacterized protein n=1 Tax=Ancylostoma ceylanicum TaxID=53326 RepID=A0A016TRY4_9BILA|nr:hypothetical protein Y032_0083g1629 [Ancylostoma ceylanicum]